MKHEENYFEKMYKEIRRNWLKYMTLDGIGERYSLEEFYAEMQSEDGDRQRAIDLIEAKVPSTITVASPFKKGITNYIIVSDMGHGVTCDKCNSLGAVILLLDKDLKTNLENKLFLPSMETYYMLGIKQESQELLRYPPIPINTNTDYWYCPYCNEMHRLGEYYQETRDIYDQKVINVKVDMVKHLKKNKDLEMMEGLFDLRRLF